MKTYELNAIALHPTPGGLRDSEKKANNIRPNTRYTTSLEGTSCDVEILLQVGMPRHRQSEPSELRRCMHGGALNLSPILRAATHRVGQGELARPSVCGLLLALSLVSFPLVVHGFADWSLIAQGLADESN